jgi:hypothetical protein
MARAIFTSHAQMTGKAGNGSGEGVFLGKDDFGGLGWRSRMGIAKFSQLTLCEPSFRLADGIYQNSKDSTAAINMN